MAIGDILSAFGRAIESVGTPSGSDPKGSTADAMATVLAGAGDPQYRGSSAPAARQVLKDEYKIHPAIGIARVGNHPDSFILGPEYPGMPVNPRYWDRSGKLADKEFFRLDGKMRRQAAQFRIFRYRTYRGQEEPEVTDLTDSPEVEYTDWSVQLANKKASYFEFHYLKGSEASGPKAYTPGLVRNAGVTASADRAMLDITPPRQTVRVIRELKQIPVSLDKASGGSWPGRFAVTVPDRADEITTLGELRSDAHGRLFVLGGFGISGTSGPALGSDPFNNNGWHDDTSDGIVEAEIKLRGITATVEATPARVLVAPPDYAPELANAVSLWDALYDVFVRSSGFKLNPALHDGGFKAGYRPSFTKEIYPILKRGFDYQWVASVIRSQLGHDSLVDLDALARPAVQGATTNLRLDVFKRLRDPDNPQAAPREQNMPMLFADDYHSVSLRELTLTRTQYFVMKQWANGDFISDWTGKPDEAKPGEGGVYVVQAGDGLEDIAARFKVTPGEIMLANGQIGDRDAAVETGRRLAIPPAGHARAEGLDRAALEACVGGAFAPGIEAGWTLTKESIYSAPFRFKPFDAKAPATEPGLFCTNEGRGLAPGDINRQMALPWQTDFRECSDFWWPATRPNQVTVADGTVHEWARDISGPNGIVESWWRLGFVVDEGPPGAPKFVEHGRLPISAPAPVPVP